MRGDEVQVQWTWVGDEAGIIETIAQILGPTKVGISLCGYNPLSSTHSIGKKGKSQWPTRRRQKAVRKENGESNLVGVYV
jgi:hypothetical protein